MHVYFNLEKHKLISKEVHEQHTDESSDIPQSALIGWSIRALWDVDPGTCPAWLNHAIYSIMLTYYCYKIVAGCCNLYKSINTKPRQVQCTAFHSSCNTETEQCYQPYTFNPYSNRKDVHIQLTRKLEKTQWTLFEAFSAFSHMSNSFALLSIKSILIKKIKIAQACALSCSGLHYGCLLQTP